MPLVPPEHQDDFDVWFAANPEHIEQLVQDGADPYRVWLLQVDRLARSLTPPKRGAPHPRPAS